MMNNITNDKPATDQNGGTRIPNTTEASTNPQQSQSNPEQNTGSPSPIDDETFAAVEDAFNGLEDSKQTRIDDDEQNVNS